MKKIDLSPLPQQTDDYSHYEETVVRWDRIIGFAFGVVCVAALGIYLAFFQSTDLDLASSVKLGNSVDQAPANTNESPNQKAEAKANLKQEIVLQSKDSNLSGSAEVSEQSEPIETKKVVISVNNGNEIPEKSELPSSNVVSGVATKDVLQTNTQVEQVPVEQVQFLQATSEENPSAKHEEFELAPIVIVNSGVQQAVLSLANDKALPGEPMTKIVPMNERGLIKVALYTVMKGIRGKTLYHEWYRNDVRQARVKIPVNVTLQKSYSSKFIDKQMVGQWKVKVVDKNGELYVLADFEVIR